MQRLIVFSWMMNDPDGDQPRVAADDSLTAGRCYKWFDDTGRPWQIELSPNLIRLRGGDAFIELSAESWVRDIYVAPHGDRFIIRFETFDLAVGFVVSADEAAPVLEHVGATPEGPTACPEPIADSVASEPLLWPKVSSLAVWALICSVFVFIPIIGLLPAIATGILLARHRAAVRRAGAWSHSRALCKAAFVFLVAGLVTSAVATTVLMQNVEYALRADSLYGEGSLGAEDETSAGPANSRIDRGEPHRSTEPVPKERNWGILAAGLFVVLLSLTCHEAAHAITAWWLGDDFARRLGRVTLNPMAHIDPIGTLLLPLILFLANAGIFGWARPVPVRTEQLARPRRAHILISAAGPAANLLLAAASMLIMLGLGGIVGLVAPDAIVTNFVGFDFSAGVTASGFLLAPIFGPLCTVLKLSFIVNVLLAFFNLIPIPPLDGSWILEHLFPSSLGPIYERIRPYGFLLFLALIWTGVLSYLLYPVFLVLLPGFALLDWCTSF